VLDAATAADPDLLDKWKTVKDWTESSRYTPRTRAEAEDLYKTIADKKHGILPWVKKYW
jgi:hypothetical protein